MTVISHGYANHNVEQLNSAKMSADQSHFVYLFSGLAPVCIAAVTPFITYGHVKHQPAALIKSRLSNEIGRQSMAGLVSLLSYFTGGEITRQCLKPFKSTPYLKDNDASQHIAMLVGGVTFQFFASSYLRPWLSNHFIDLVERKWDGWTSKTKAIPRPIRETAYRIFLKRPVIGSLLVGISLLGANFQSSLTIAKYQQKREKGRDTAHYPVARH